LSIAAVSIKIARKDALEEESAPLWITGKIRELLSRGHIDAHGEIVLES